MPKRFHGWILFLRRLSGFAKGWSLQDSSRMGKALHSYMGDLAASEYYCIGLTFEILLTHQIDN